MQRLAIIADIHANLYALEAFLAYLRAEFPATLILNAGDFVQIGPHPRQVAEIVLGDSRFLSVLGNNELSLLERQPEAFRAEEFAHQDWTIAQLGPDLLAEVGRLPCSRLAPLAGLTVGLYHARPGDPLARPLLYQPGRSLEEFVGDYPAEADWVVFGHTHLQAYIKQWPRKTLLNPGALGCSKEGRISFCLVELSEQGASVAFKTLAYDRTRLRADYCRLAVPAAEELLLGFHGL
jgi:predicted phosphodiesterase